MKIFWYWPHPHGVMNPEACELVRRGHDLTVQTQRSFAGRLLPVEDFGYPVVRDLPEVGRVRGRKVRGRLFRQVQLAQRQCLKIIGIVRSSPDVVHFQLLEDNVDWLTIRLIRLLTHARLVGVVHDVRPHVATLPPGLESLLLRLMYRDGCLHQILVYHDALRDELVNEFGVDPSRIVVIPLPVYRGDIPKRSSVVGRLQVLFLGTLRENKGLAVLVDAISSTPAMENVQYVIAGRGSDHLEDMVRDLAARRPDVVAEVGRYSEGRKRQLLVESDLLVLPYTSFHSQSAVLADGYSYGIPLLVTDVGAIGPTVRNDESGWVVPPNDSAALRNMIDYVLKSPEDYRRKVAGVERAGLQHSPALIVDGLEEAYGWIDTSEGEL